MHMCRLTAARRTHQALSLLLFSTFLLTSCGSVNSSPDHRQNAPSAAAIQELPCETVEDTDRDFDLDQGAPEGAHRDPLEAVASYAASEALTSTGTRDVEVSSTRWHRLANDGRLLYEFRLERYASSQEWYVQGLRRCFPYE